MNAFTQPPFPTNPSVGERYGQWVWNGARWVCSTQQGVMVNTVVFTASGPYQPSPGLISALVECVGGGGAGGSVSGLAASTAGVGGGGGSGGYSRVTLAAALVQGGVTVTIGAGGVPQPTDQAGGNGSATSFGAFCVANGGSFGGAANAGEWGGGGNGGVMGTGSPAFQGSIGNDGYLVNVPGGGFGMEGGGGADSFFQGGGRGGGNAGTMVAGVAGAANTGGGGGGGWSNYVAQGATVILGGAGGSGICIVTEYCFNDTGTGEDCLTPTVNVNAKVAVTKVPWRPGGQPCDPCGPHAMPVEYFEDD